MKRNLYTVQYTTNIKVKMENRPRAKFTYKSILHHWNRCCTDKQRQYRDETERQEYLLDGEGWLNILLRLFYFFHIGNMEIYSAVSTLLFIIGCHFEHLEHII